MVYSKALVVVGGQGAHDWMAGAVVVPDHRGECEDALQDPDGHAAGGAAVVTFGVELAIESLVDRFDDLPQRFEEM